MSEEVKSKKVRIYKFASEHNLSAESLVEFLQKKGYEIKSHMSALTDEMLTDINTYFKRILKRLKNITEKSQSSKEKELKNPKLLLKKN